MEFEIRQDRRPGGGKRLTAERAEYFRLMQLGLSSEQACRRVGISVHTGRVWRNGTATRAGRKAVPPIFGKAPPSGRSRYLGEEDRVLIADRLGEKATVRAIAAELGRAPSTVSREIRRNRNPSARVPYRPHAAQRRADDRKPRPKIGKIAANPELRAVIQDHLGRKRSPEQIAGVLRRDFPDRPEMHVVHETIYQALYLQGRGELRREITQALRTGRARREPHNNRQRRRPRFIDPIVSISERPAEAADRAVPGHWEGDLIIGKNSASAIGTLVERTTRFVMLVHLPAGRDALSVRDALIATVAQLPEHLKRSLAWDQGPEMAAHRTFSIATNIPVFFCDPASPWQRGSNENTNGLLRQYFPKGTDLGQHSREHLDFVAAELNDRPRKTFGWDSPAERLATVLTTTN
jgi:IS30 family transposase